MVVRMSRRSSGLLRTYRSPSQISSSGFRREGFTGSKRGKRAVSTVDTTEKSEATRYAPPIPIVDTPARTPAAAGANRRVRLMDIEVKLIALPN